MKRFLLSSLGLPFLGLCLLLGVLLISQFRSIRLDLTSEGLYTLSEGTQHILDDIPESNPVQLSLFFSEKLSRQSPALRAYYQRVRDLLEEYELKSGGRLLVKYVDPEPFSEEEDFAVQFGLQAIPVEGENIYFGLIGLNANDEMQVIPFFNPEHQAFLEYEVSQLVYRLGESRRPVLGVITGLPQIFPHMDIRGQQRNEGVVIMDQLGEQYEIKRVMDTDVETIAPGIDILMVVHPHLFPERTLYAIEQFVLSGKPLIVFMDPEAEMDTFQMPLDNGFVDRSSSLEQLLGQWGIQYDPASVLLDYTYAHEIPASQFGRPIPHLGIFGISKAGMNASDAITAGLEEINFASAGAMLPIEGAAVDITPLLTSSVESQLYDTEQYKLGGSHDILLRNFKADAQQYFLAVHIQGRVETAFPDGAPELADPQQHESGEDLPAHIGQGDIQVILVSDTDLLADRMWVQVQQVYGKKLATPWAGNGDLVRNMVDKLAGSPDLIGLRSRGSYQKPFETVDALKKQAVEQFREQEKQLAEKLAQTEKKLQQLMEQAETDSAIDESRQNEIRAFQMERLQTRKKLREVQHQLNADIETLATRLKLLNILAVPLLLTLISLLVMLLKRSRPGGC